MENSTTNPLATLYVSTTVNGKFATNLLTVIFENVNVDGTSATPADDRLNFLSAFVLSLFFPPSVD